MLNGISITFLSVDLLPTYSLSRYHISVWQKDASTKGKKIAIFQTLYLLSPLLVTSMGNVLIILTLMFVLKEEILSVLNILGIDCTCCQPLRQLLSSYSSQPLRVLAVRMAEPVPQSVGPPLRSRLNNGTLVSIYRFYIHGPQKTTVIDFLNRESPAYIV